jgi:hypothetical protein
MANHPITKNPDGSELTNRGGPTNRDEPRSDPFSTIISQTLEQTVDSHLNSLSPKPPSQPPDDPQSLSQRNPTGQREWLIGASILARKMLKVPQSL